MPVRRKSRRKRRSLKRHKWLVVNNELNFKVFGKVIKQEDTTS